MILVATQCFPPKRGGIETYLGGLAQALVEAGEEVEVLADGAAAPEDQALPHRVTRFAGLKPLRAWRKAGAVAARLAEGRCEKLICDSWKSLETVLRAPAARAGAARLLTLAHGMELPAAPSPAKRGRLIAALGAADGVLAVSDYTAARAAPYLTDPSKIAVLAPPIAPQPEATPEARAALRDRLRAAGLEARPLVAGLARLEPRKGFDQVLRAAAALRGAYPDLAVVLAGDGPDRARLEALAEEEGAPAFFLGAVSEAEKAALFAEASLLAMPTRAEGESVEGFGLVYLEAAWHGAPALAGREGGAAAAVMEGRTGWFCDGASPSSVAEALWTALSDPETLRRRGVAAQQHAHAQSWPARVADYLRA